jgi:penicillin-binding protein 1A
VLKLPRRRTLFTVLLAVAFVGAIVIGVSLGLALAGSRNFVRTAQFAEHEPALPTRVLDVHDRLITEFFGVEKRTMITLDEMPRHLIDAVLTREDGGFYSHHGFSLRGFSRALWNTVTGQYVSGGSTITQQLAGRLYADRTDISVRRKLVELWYAIQMERQYTKDEILEMYLNEMDFGHNTQGVGAAAEFFFRKQVKDLTVAESVMLAIQLARPGLYSPIKNPKSAKIIQREILDQMTSLGYVAKADADASFAQYWAAWDPTRPNSTAFFDREDKAPYFSEYIRSLLDELLVGSYDYLRDGLVVHTTLDLDDQRVADELMIAGIEDVNTRYLALNKTRVGYSNAAFLPLLDFLSFGLDISDLRNRERTVSSQARTYYLEKLNPLVEMAANLFDLQGGETVFTAGYNRSRALTARTEVQGALVSIDSRTGHILAMVGGRKWDRTDQFNRVVSGRMQPGSSYKPLYYSAAIASRKFTPATMILDAPVVFMTADGKTWEPMNFKGTWQGRVLLRSALAHSMNVPSLKVLDGIGFDAAIQTSSRMLGVTNPAEIEERFPRYYPLGLGVISVSPLEMVRAFATFPNQGREVVPVAIRYIEDRNGKIILEPEKETLAAQARKGESAQIISPQVAYIMTSLLQSTVSEGTLAGAASTVGGFDRPMAGKTGTTENWSDAWTVGFSPQVTTAVWYGFDLGNRSLGVELTGATTAGYAWARYMKTIHRTLPVEQYAKPPTGLSTVSVCAVSGQLPTQYCPNIIPEIFLSGTEPRVFCELHQYESSRSETIEGNLRRGLLGTDFFGTDTTPAPGDLLQDAPEGETGNPLLD